MGFTSWRKPARIDFVLTKVPLLYLSNVAGRAVYDTQRFKATDKMLEDEALSVKSNQAKSNRAKSLAVKNDLGSLPTCSKRLSIIIVNYNVLDFLKLALDSVSLACANLDAEIIVVDNNSADGSVEMVASSFPEVILIENKENTGFSRANNQGIKISRGEYILILNPDTIVSEDTFEVLIDLLESRPEAGAAGCQILHPNGTFARESRRAFPTPLVAFFRVTGLSTLFPKSRLFGRYNMTYLPIDEIAEVDALSGSCMMVRRKALLADGPLSAEPNLTQPADTPRLFDEEFFMYGEDLDWCFRIQKAGWKILYTPDSEIIHYKGESTRKGELRYVRLFYGAMVRFSRKHFHGHGRMIVELLRVAIFFKAFLSVAGRAISFFLPILIDFSITFISVVLASVVRANDGLVLPITPFLLTVPPTFSLVTVLGIGLSGGYRSRTRNIRSVVAGLLLAILVISAASFFVKQIAFSRLIILLSACIAGVFLGLVRLRLRYNASTISRLVLLGSKLDADQLLNAISLNPNPSFELVGLIPHSSLDESDLKTSAQIDLPILGRLDQLRDIVRLREIDTIVIASGRLPNHEVFKIIRQLRDLKVTFRMLTDTHDRIIGKASVNDLSAPRMLDVNQVLAKPRSLGQKRVFDVAVASVALVAYPVRLLFSGFKFTAVHKRSILLMDVLLNRIALVGTRKEDLPLGDTPSREGLFSIVDVLPGPLDQAAKRNAYDFYAANESAQLDWDIIIRSIRKGRIGPIDTQNR